MTNTQIKKGIQDAISRNANQIEAGHGKIDSV